MLPTLAAPATALLLAEKPVVLIVEEVEKHANELAKSLRTAGLGGYRSDRFCRGNKGPEERPRDALFLSVHP